MLLSSKTLGVSTVSSYPLGTQEHSVLKALIYMAHLRIKENMDRDTGQLSHHS